MSDNTISTKYLLQSLVTGNVFNDTGWLLDAPGESKPGLIRAIYEKKQLHVKAPSFGLYYLSHLVDTGPKRELP